MLKKLGKISVLTVIAALFVFAFAGAAFAEETDGEQLVQPAQIEEHELPVGGWAPAEPIYVPTDLVVNNGDNSGKTQSSKRRINSDPNSVFTKGAATTGYEALDEAQKELYEAIDAAFVKFMNAEKDLSPTEVTLDGEDVDRYIIEAIDYTQMGIAGDTKEERKQNALIAFYAYDYDHPAYYWLSNEILFNEENVYPCTEKEYASVSTRNVLNAQVSSSVKAYADFAGNGSTLDKVALVHDKIVNDIDYAYKDNDGSTPEPAKWAHSVHGVFDPKYKHAVCEGYADAFALIMNYLEIPNYYIVGEAGSGGPGGGAGHAWNAVYDEDAERYLYMDLTWDDWGENGYSYEYFGMPMTNFEEDHHEYKADAAQAKDWLYNIDGEYNDSLLGTYYNRGGFYYDKSTSDANDFATAAKAKAARAGGWVSVLCTDQDSIDEITPVLGVTKSDIVKYKYDEESSYNCGYLIAPAVPEGYKHEHAWTDSTYIWAPDNSQVTAFRICKAPNCDTIAECEMVDTTFQGTAPTCTAVGQGTYTATFENAAFTEQTKEGEFKALGHRWGKPTYDWADDNSTVTAKRECKRKTGSSCIETESVETTSETTEATCTKNGKTTYSATFENGAFSVEPKEVTIKALGHDWDEPAYTWAEDNSTVTAKRECKRKTGSSCIETESVETTSETTEATCTKNGKTTYSATFENGAFSVEPKEVTIKALGHDWDEPAYTWAEDNSTVTAKRVCQNNTEASCTEIEAVQPTVDVSEEATCTEAGYGTFSATFKNTAFTEQTKEGIIKALGHDWGAPTYTWSGYSQVTAKRVCSRQCGNSGIEIETANTTSKITRAATYTEQGQTTYTAAFANPIFRAQAKTVTNIPMLAKKANPMKVKATAKTVKVKTLKKKALTVVPLKVTSAKGKVTYKVIGGNAKSKKALKLNAKTGKVTVKKKTKKGKYQIKVRVTAAGATAFKALSKTVTVTVNAK